MPQQPQKQKQPDLRREPEELSTEAAMPAYLIDASIYIFQAHFSPHIECEDQDGNDVSALFGFTQFLLQFMRRIRPDYLAVAQDTSLFCGFRHQLCSRYKANRVLPDENLARQLSACGEVCGALGLSGFASLNYEADDIIGTLGNRLRSQPDGHSLVPKKICVVSRDKDLAQVLHDVDDVIWDYSRNRKRNRVQIYDEYGIHPHQIPDYLGLIGDSVDNILGVPGIGPVSARELLRNFNTLEGVYENLDQVASLSLRGAVRLSRLLQENREQAVLAKQLATIVTDVDDQAESFSIVPLQSLRRRAADAGRFQSILVENGFNDRLADRLTDAAEQLSRV
ncbi:MAG: 5'-3' exonuclease H3TH domain-containing protein [Pseudohongiellaceae bacterium]